MYRFSAGILGAVLCLSGCATAQVDLTIQSDNAGPTINRDIFGQFSEHLGQGIYGGVWVGEDSSILNVRGIRSDVVDALKALKVPVVRWPGGCFADQYHWRDGIGPIETRRAGINVDWGGVIEPNHFGTHEFMDFVEQIGSEAYISLNVGIGSVQEAIDWLEYMTIDKPTSLGLERQVNGRADPWKVKYIGIGNESWGCGGPLSAEAYVDRLKLFSHFVLNHHPEQAATPVPEFLANLDPAKIDPHNPDFTLMDPQSGGMQRIAVGPDRNDTEYTETVMKAWRDRKPMFWNIEGLSLHSYTFGGDFPMVSPSTGFGEREYAGMLAETLRMDDILTLHSGIMDKYDPDRKVGLIVDEWGAWLKPVPGLNPVFLKQQNTLRDGILAALNINIFARHADRVRMTNIAQMVNVIQSMILTDGPNMVLTPTYHVYEMYVPFQDATLLPVSLEQGVYAFDDIELPALDAIAARAEDGEVWLAVTNLSPDEDAQIRIDVDGEAFSAASGRMLSAPEVSSFNAFDSAPTVFPEPFEAKAKDGDLVLEIPAKSVVVVQLKQAGDKG